MKKGFTLIEVLIVIAIVGIIAAIIIPAIMEAKNKKDALYIRYDIVRIVQTGEKGNILKREYNGKDKVWQYDVRLEQNQQIVSYLEGELELVSRKEIGTSRED